eukprot:m.89126 g.89126  ORF g.89126 m.89126 type:complete len:125 (+) comp11705_c0_seq3:187-561(+)
MLSDGVALDTDVVSSTYVHIAMWPPQTFLGCQVMSDALARCRERVAKTGAGACVTEAKMHALCRQTQRADQQRVESACLSSGKGWKQLEKEYVQCHKNAWFWTDCLGPLKEFAQCAQTLSQRPA